MAYLRCTTCGTFVDEQFTTCPRCGSRLYDHTRKKNRGGAVVWIVILVFLAAVCFFGLRAFKTFQEQQALQEQQAALEQKALQEQDYEEKLRNAVYEIVISAAETEEAGNRLLDVWYNWAYNIKDPETDEFTRKDEGTGDFYEDINDVIDALFEDPDYSSTLERIMDSQNDLARLLREMSDPPEKYKIDYEDLRILYSAYVEFSNIVLNPHGNLNSFSEKYKAADEKVVNCYYPLSIYLNG